MLAARDTYLTQNTLFNAMSLICGIMFPISYLPEWVQQLAAFIPLTPAVTLFRRVVIGGETLAVNGDLCIQIFALSGIYLIIGIISYRKMERTLLERVFG